MLAELRKSARALDINLLLDECILETKEELFALVNSQLDKGQSSEDYLPLYKNAKYAAYKQRIGSKAPNGITDLKLTGAFRSKFKLRLFKNSVIIRSSDKKNSILLNKYGPELFQLNDENTTIYAKQILLPLLNKKIKNVLFK